MNLTRDRGGFLRRATPEVLPSALGWSPSWGIYRDPRSQRYRVGLDPASRLVSTTNTYYIAKPADGGSDLNTGTTIGSPFASVWKAINAAGVTASTIYIKAGRYDYENAVSGLNVGFGCNLIGYGGRVVLTTQPNTVSWSDAGSGAWSTTYATTPYGVVDESNRDAYGVGTWLTAQASVAAVQSSGGWFWSAGTLTIKTFDARTPDSSIVAPLSSSSRWSFRAVSSVNVYMSGIDFLGGYRCAAHAVGQFTAVDCTFGYAEYIGWEVVTATETQLWRCKAIGTYGTGGAGGDGIGYQAASAGNGLEVDCDALSNGWDGVGISNGSSTHGSRVIRCGGRYMSNQGPNLADVLNVAAGLSVNLGCMVGASRGTAGTSRSNIATDGNGSTMWLADCSLDGSGTQDLWTGTTGGSVINLRATGYSGSTGSGTVGTW